MEELLPGLWRIPVPLPGNPLRELNSYLIKGAGENLLIDTGFRMPECREALNAALAELGVRREETDILLTHLHSDHSGLAPELVGEGRTIYVGRVDLPYLARSDRWKDSWGNKFLDMGFSREEVALIHTDNPAEALAPVTCDQYAPLDEEDRLTYGGYTLEAIDTPGHTPGHICFAIKEERVLFTGDHILFDISPNITDWDGVPDALGNYLHSLDKMAAYAGWRALPGHRGTGDLIRRVEELKAHHAERLGEILDAVRSRPGATPYELTGLVRWKIRAKSWEDFPLAQKWFAVGECQSHLDHLEAKGLVRKDWDGAVRRYTAIKNEERMK